MTHWRKIQVSDSEDDAVNCLIWLETDLENVACKCHITDLVNVYSEALDQKLVKNRFEELNQDLEIDDFKEVLKAIQKNLAGDCDKNSQVKLEAAFDKSDNNGDDFMKVVLSWSEEGLPFVFQFQLCKDSNKNVRDLVISKLFNCLLKYQSVQDVLLTTIREKDLELEDYAGSGCKLTRKGLKTGWFVGLDKVLDETKPDAVPEMCEYFGSPKFLKLLKSSELQKPSGKTVSNDESAGNCDKDTKVEEDKSVAKKRKLEKPAKPNLAKISKNYGFNNKTKKAKLNL